VGGPPLGRGWTPKQLRRLRDEDPERYREIVRELNEATGDAWQSFSAAVDAMREPPRILAPWELAEPDEPETEATPSGSLVKRKRAGKSYDSELAIEAIRRVAAAPRPSRRLRDLLHDERPDIPTPLIDRVLDQTRDKRSKGQPYKRLSPSRRERWERAVERLVENGTTTLDELTRLLK
jgi:hypothetical protein